MRGSQHEQADEAEHHQHGEHAEDESFLLGHGKGHNGLMGRTEGGRVESKAEGGEVGHDPADDGLTGEFPP